ncbi:MAG TPA: MerR family transcriptional regulator, partial [Acidimicrobiia bacterium]|nr:MerR family transcriptional regulator [Acidimicrobiia bacterium]
LIDPERTPSGYRKFYDADLARLRWILYQQKEHFLPLKVIRERLDGLGEGDLPAAAQPPDSDAAEPNGNGTGPAVPVTSVHDNTNAETVKERPARPRAAASGGISLTRDELGRAAGLDEAQIAELESFGLLTPFSRSSEQALFDEEGLTVARTAVEFYKHGFEARHLRMYKHFAQREADLFEQVLLGYLRQRNPEARAKAQGELGELARLGRNLRAALLVTALRESLTE